MVRSIAVKHQRSKPQSSQHRRGAPRVAALLAAAVAVALCPAPAAGDPRDAGTAAVVAHAVPLASLLGIRRYWTPQRMLRATPRESSRDGADRRAARTTTSAGAGAAWNRGGTVARTSGKVFFTLDGRDYLCSATVVRAGNRDTVATAGHCAKDGTGPWAGNWLFVPGYRDGRRPYGSYPARRMFVPGEWSRKDDGDYDVAMVALATARGRHVQDAVGGHPIEFGRRDGSRAYIFGYPTAGRYDGERLAYCTGRPRTDPRNETTGRGLRCDLTEGASGGAWFGRFDSVSGTGVLTSVSSFKFADDAGTMYAPYFGDAVRTVYRRAART